MRRRIALLVAGVLVAAGAALTGCPAAHNSYPGTSCMVDSDCYVGERCSSSVCVPNEDMTIIGDFAHPPLDFSMMTDGGGTPDDLASGDM